MRYCVRFTALATLLAATTLAWDTSLSAQELDIQGTWIRASEDDSHQRGLLLFTPTTYSYMVVLGEDPRTPFSGDEPGDAERLAAWRTFAGHSGQYRIESGRIVYQAYMSRNPSYMDGWPDNERTWTVEIAGDVLTLTNQSGVARAWRRVEDGMADW